MAVKTKRGRKPTVRERIASEKLLLWYAEWTASAKPTPDGAHRAVIQGAAHPTHQHTSSPLDAVRGGIPGAEPKTRWMKISAPGQFDKRPR